RITEFKDIGADVIVNAANMEVQFGGGVSGVIAKAAGGGAIANAIDQEAQELLQILHSRALKSH
ncbi:MAG: hypothetical protein HQK50_18165, partial [Oligoflexia bacterium]|nr:hypothetical protein [Oligoflexia bacterium]